MNKTKIIVKVDDTNNTKEFLKELILNGIDAFCIDLSKFDHSFCLDVIDKINKLNEQLNTNVAIILETVGTKVHTNRFYGGSAVLKDNDKIRIYMNDVLGDETKFSVDYVNFLNDAKYDSTIKLSNGLVELKVLDKGDNFLLCQVIKGGQVYDNSDVIVPGIKYKNKFLSEVDRDNIIFASENNVDYISLSYVSGVDDVLDVNDLLIDLENNHLGILAKIENEFALAEIDDIINISDGLIIARDSLGIELPIERIPGIQKSLINKCHLASKISVVATEIVSSQEQQLTKAEVSDIANAVLDGTDAVMFSDNNFKVYSMEALKITERVIKETEPNIDYMHFLDITMRSENHDVTGSVASSAASIANNLKCKAIVTPTISGYTARKMSRFRPMCPIIAISTDREIVKSLALYFGVYPILIDNLKSLDDIMLQARKIVLENFDVVEGDKIIITGGYPFKAIKHTNLIEIEEL